MSSYDLRAVNAKQWVQEAMDAPDQQWLIDDLVPAGALTLIAGRPKIGFKSFLSQSIALSVASGQRVGPLNPSGAPLPVLYIDREGVLKPTAQRYMALAKGMNVEISENLHIAFNVPFRMDNTQCVADVRRLAAELGAKLVIIDTLAKSMSGNESSAQDMGQALLCAEALKSDGIAVIVVHHLNKAGRLEAGEQMDPASGLRGSSALEGAYDQILSCQAATSDGEHNLYMVRGGKYAGFEAAVIKWTLKNKIVDNKKILDTASVEIGEFGDLPVQDEPQSTKQRVRF